MLICLLAISPNAHSQFITNFSGTEIYVSSKEILSITEGEFVNNGTVTNRGSLYIGGDWTNNETYSLIDSGRFILSGDKPQLINHNNQSVYTLIIDGAGEKTLGSDLSVVNTFELVNGLITPTENFLLTMNDGTIVQDGNNNSYVNGALYHVGIGDKLYPIGKNNHYSPVTLLDVQGDAPTIGFEVFEPNTDPQYPKVLQSVSETRYWKKTILAGTLDGGRINLRIAEDEGIDDITLAVITATETLGGIFKSMGIHELLHIDDPQKTSVTSNNNIIAAVDYYAIGEEFDFSKIECVPNAFSTASPNTDENVLKVYCTNLNEENFSFTIFDKWGLIVYDTKSVEVATQKGWDGINPITGLKAKNDVYRYILSGRYNNGKTFKKFGTITKLN